MADVIILDPTGIDPDAIDNSVLAEAIRRAQADQDSDPIATHDSYV